MGGIASFFSPKLPSINIPEVPKAIRMPDQNDPAVLETRRKAVATANAQRGRQATDLVGNEQRAAPTYLNDTLGQT